MHLELMKVSNIQVSVLTHVLVLLDRVLDRVQTELLDGLVRLDGTLVHVIR